MIFKPKIYSNVKVAIYVTTICNIKCEYCSARRNLKSKWGNVMNIHKLELLKPLIRDEWEILLVGGEPSIHPKFFDIIDLFKDHEMSVFSNGKRMYKHFDESYKNLQFSITYHDIDKDLFLKNIEPIRDRIYKLKLMLSGDNYAQKLKDAEYFEDHGYEVEFRSIDDVTENYKNIPKKYQETSDFGSKFLLDNKEISIDEALDFNFRDWTCDPIIISVYPDLSGRINCIYEENILRYLKNPTPLTCKKDHCSIWFLEGEKYDNAQL